MSIKKDILCREDLWNLLLAFYEKVKFDNVIGFIFNDVAKVNWDIHLPVICDFWEGVLFNKNIYKGNPLMVHLDLNKKVLLEKKYFERWLLLFRETVDDMFSGTNAALAIQRAQSIATVIQIKIANAKDSASLL